jgi:hypothetical protein
LGEVAGTISPHNALYMSDPWTVQKARLVICYSLVAKLDWKALVLAVATPAAVMKSVGGRNEDGRSEGGRCNLNLRWGVRICLPAIMVLQL